jgi:hypothetical protein
MKYKDLQFLQEAYKSVCESEEQISAKSTQMLDILLRSKHSVCLKFEDFESVIPFKQIYNFVTQSGNRVHIITFGKVSIPSALAKRVDFDVNPSIEMASQILDGKIGTEKLYSQTIVICPENFSLSPRIERRCAVIHCGSELDRIRRLSGKFPKDPSDT